MVKFKEEKKVLNLNIEQKINYRHRLTQINTDKTNYKLQNLCNLWLKSAMLN